MGASERISPCYGGGHSEWMPGLLSDLQIRHLAEQHGMIEPFEPVAVREMPSGQKVVSYGVTSYGYDIRVAHEFKVFTPTYCAVVDPKQVDARAFTEMHFTPGVIGEAVMIPPNSFVLARSLERFNIPRDVLAVVIGKSTYARCGLVVNCTPLEPLWTGYLTIEISNTTPLPARVYANEGIAQVLFYKASQVCLVSYAEKDGGKPGKFQNQGPEITLPRM